MFQCSSRARAKLMLYVALLHAVWLSLLEQGDSYIARFKMFSYGVLTDSECILLIICTGG